MIVTDENISEEGDTSDHAYGSSSSEEEKMYGESEVEAGYDDCGDEEGADVEEEEKQQQEGPEYKYKSFEETETGIPRREAESGGIDRLETTIGGKFNETKTGTQIFQIK